MARTLLTRSEYAIVSPRRAKSCRIVAISTFARSHDESENPYFSSIFHLRLIPILLRHVRLAFPQMLDVQKNFAHYAEIAGHAVYVSRSALYRRLFRLAVQIFVAIPKSN